MSETPDLSQWDDDYEEAPVKEHEFDNVPDGKYEVAVDRVSITTSKGTGQPLVKWCLKILGPEFAGRLLWRNNQVATRENLSWLKSDLYCCGLRLGKLSELEQHLDELHGVRLAVTVKTKGEFQSVYFNKRLDEQPAAEPGAAAEPAPPPPASAPHDPTDRVPF